MPDPSNPLRKHFRQPAIYIRLPSQGKFYPQGTVTIPVNSEIPVLPMTAIDEITSRTPDALFNGSAVTEIIKSCFPNINNPWAVNSVDINALLVAARLASYGHLMDISTVCPMCNHEHEYQVDLRNILDSFSLPDYDTPLIVGDLSIHFTPLTYKQLNEHSKIQFEDQKLMQLLPSADMPEADKMARLGEAFRKITALTVKSIAESVGVIKTSDAMVTDRAHIEEFLHNCSKATFEEIKQRAIALREACDIKPLTITCDECNHTFSQQFTLDMTNFFVTAS